MQQDKHNSILDKKKKDSKSHKVSLISFTLSSSTFTNYGIWHFREEDHQET